MKGYTSVIVWIIVLFIFSPAVLAGEVAGFLNKANVKTYDCPDDSYVPELENLLTAKSTSGIELIELNVYKAHWLICVGKYAQAKSILKSISTENKIDKTSRSYASLTYQFGFILDVNDDPKRCDYYRQSASLAKGKFNDIYLSSQLGLITVCDQDKQSIGVKLGQLFSLVKIYTNEQDIESLAHVHNNIGLLYSSIGQNALAAEQYEKSYRLGLTVYEEKNQLAPLISVITAYSGSGDYENAMLMIEELGRGNIKVNTPLTNSWYHYALSRHYYRTNNYEALRESLAKWEIFLAQISNKQMNKLHEWYSAALCLHDQDKACVKAFMSAQQDTETALPTRLSNHIHYIAFLVKAYLFLEDIDSAQQSFARYATSMHEKVRVQQKSARVLGVANLHTEILALEENLADVKANQVQKVLVIMLIILAIAVLVYWTIGKNYLKKLATDKLTGLQNEQSVLSQIKRVKAPLLGKVNALALFDVNNFTEVNRQSGYMSGDDLLKRVATCLKKVTRDKDIVGRIGADQFIVCLKNIDEQTANELFERILQSLALMACNDECGEKVNVRSSMSVYSSVNDFADLDDVLSEIRNILRKKPVTKIQNVDLITE